MGKLCSTVVDDAVADAALFILVDRYRRYVRPSQAFPGYSQAFIASDYPVAQAWVVGDDLTLPVPSQTAFDGLGIFFGVKTGIVFVMDEGRYGYRQRSKWLCYVLQVYGGLGGGA
jgi:hypothetical protein